MTINYQPGMAHGVQAFLDHLDAALVRHTARTLAQLRAGVDSGILTNGFAIAVEDAIRTINDGMQAELEGKSAKAKAAKAKS